MPVMNIWQVAMFVLERIMRMPVRMALIGHIPFMRVSVVRIVVLVAMVMRHDGVSMCMTMLLVQQQQRSYCHERQCEHQQDSRRFTQQQN